MVERPLHSLADTKKLAEMLASQVRCGDVITVAGDLGAGKTTFAQFLIGALSPEKVEVTSPTFTLLQTYDVVSAQGQTSELHHYDLYRIEHASALAELGLEDALNGITLIEWPERLGGYRLPVSLALSFTLKEDGSRNVSIVTHAPHLKAFA